MLKEFFIFDAKNGLFKSSQIKPKQNPLSACANYGCNGFGNVNGKQQHKTALNCPNFKVGYISLPKDNFA